MNGVEISAPFFYFVPEDGQGGRKYYTTDPRYLSRKKCEKNKKNILPKSIDNTKTI